MSVPRIEAIALVGSKNQRLFLSSRAQYQSGSGEAHRGNDETLRLEYAAHCSLDVVEERMHSRGAGDSSSTAYLGLVLTLEDLAIYALVTSTKLKILLILRPGEAKIRDLDCITVLRAVHTCYLSYASNPFQALSSSSTSGPAATSGIGLGPNSTHVEIKSQQFEKRIRAIGGW